MRILHLVHQYAPHYVGGTELYTETIARGQVGLGHETAVFCPSPTPPTSAPYELTHEQGVAVYRVPIGSRSRLKVFGDTFRHKRLAEAFTAVCAHYQPDLIHIQHLMGLPLSLITHLPLRQPYIVTLHDYWYVCANGQLLTNDTHQTCAGPNPNYHNCGRCAVARGGWPALAPAAPLLAPILRYRNQQLHTVLARARRVIAPTQFVCELYASLGLPTANMQVVRHGIAVPTAEIARLRAARPYAPQRPLRVGYVGSIAPQKGVHLLVEAVRTLPPDEVQLSLFGGLSDFPDYVTMLKEIGTAEHIHFVGRVSRPQLWDNLANLDVLVLPTLWYEASPLIIDEAFAIGLPIIAADIGAMSEKIRDNIDGRLFPPNHVEALRRILADFIASPAQLEAFHQAILPIRTIDDHLQELEQTYQLALASPAPSAPPPPHPAYDNPI